MRALIVGAERLGRVLAHELLHAGHDIRVLDSSEERLRRLPAALEGRALRGSPLQRDTLAGALAGCDGLAAVSDDDALNTVVALAARRELHVPIAVALIGNPARAEALAGLGVHIVCPTTRSARELHLILVRAGIESELELGPGAAVYRAELPARLIGRSLSELERPREVLPVALERRGRVLLAAPGMLIEGGDVLHVAASSRDLIADLSGP